jgi:hypothetical protein
LGGILPSCDQKKWACDFNKGFIGNFSKNSLDLNIALLEVSITRHDSKNNLMSIEDNLPSSVN